LPLICPKIAETVDLGGEEINGQKAGKMSLGGEVTTTGEEVDFYGWNIITSGIFRRDFKVEKQADRKFEKSTKKCEEKSLTKGRASCKIILLLEKQQMPG